jgi:hypothetical protein
MAVFAKMMLGITLALALASVAVMAAEPYVNIEQRLTTEQLHATGLDTLSPAQLEQLNLVLRDEMAKHDESVRVAIAEKPGVDDASAHASYMGLDQEPIKSRLKGSVSGWEPGTEFQLENGQTWKVLKGSMKLRKPLQSPEVLVVPGFAGRWFFQVDEDLPKARVYRID